MKSLIANVAGTIGAVGCAIVVVVVLVLLSWGGYLAYLQFVYPRAQTLQYQGIKHSQGYVQSQNAHAEDLIHDYNIAVSENDQAHAKADLADICDVASTLDSGELFPDVSAFVGQHCTQ